MNSWGLRGDFGPIQKIQKIIGLNTNFKGGFVGTFSRNYLFIRTLKNQNTKIQIIIFFGGFGNEHALKSWKNGKQVVYYYLEKMQKPRLATGLCRVFNLCG